MRACTRTHIQELFIAQLAKEAYQAAEDQPVKDVSYKHLGMSISELVKYLNIPYTSNLQPEQSKETLTK